MAASELTIADDGRLEALLRLRSKVEGLADAFAEVISMTESLAEEDGTAAALLRESLGLVKKCSAHAEKRISAARAPRRITDPTDVSSGFGVDLSEPPPPEAITSVPVVAEGGDALDKEEREERLLAARRALFAAGAAEEDEQLDWSATAAGGDDEDESDPSCAPGDEYDADVAAARVLDGLEPPAALETDACVKPSCWMDEEGYVAQGTPGFNAFARSQMAKAGVPSNDKVLPSEELKPATWVGQPTPPTLQPYQETVAYLCRPQSLPNPRMLVVHRTGCGKTATMIQIVDNYYLDRRPKVLIFPTNAVCNSFYRELRNPMFPNRYADYLARGGFHDAKKALELTGILRNGCVLDEFIAHPDLPSAPLRAFSYTMAGGASSCGQRPNAVFKCPDGYAGSYPERVPPQGGYADFECGYNPFSNKVVLMDEVHNLVRPSMEILRNEKRCLMLQRLRHLLRTAENSVIIGLTGTPLCDVPAESAALLNLIKGRHHQSLSDEGFVSYYMSTPPSVFPRVFPTGVLASLPPSSLRRVPLRNLPAPPASTVGGRRRVGAAPAGNRREYETKLSAEMARLQSDGAFGDGFDDDADEGTAVSVRSLDPIKLSILSRLCSVSQTAGYAGREDVARTVHGAPGNLLKRAQPDDAYGSAEQLKRARGYASKLLQICEDVAAAEPPLKTLVIIHRNAGYKLLLRMLARRLGEEKVRGFPPARTLAERRDAQLLPLLGFAHDESRGRASCPCALCVFNRAESTKQPSGSSDGNGDDGVRVMVADAKECSEGVSFFGVRRLILADVPTTSEDLLQRVGRAVRFMGHSALPEAERSVEVRMYVATHSRSGVTADEAMVERLREDLSTYAPELDELKAKAVDSNMWHEEKVADDGDDGLAAALDGLTLGGGGDGRDGDVLSESEEEALPPPPQAEAADEDEAAVTGAKPTPKPRKRATPKSKAVPPPSLEAEVGLVVKEEGATRTQDKENSAQRPRGSPAHDLGRVSSPGGGLSIRTRTPEPPHMGADTLSTPPLLPSPCVTDAMDGEPPEALTASAMATSTRKPPAKQATPTKRAPAKQAGGPKAANRKFVKAADRRSEDGSEGSDMDDWMVRSDESSSEAESSSSSGSFRSSQLSSGSGSEGEESEEEESSGTGTEEAEDSAAEDGTEEEETKGSCAVVKAKPELKATSPEATSSPATTRAAPPSAQDDDDDIFCSPPAEAPVPASSKRLVKQSELLRKRTDEDV